MAIGAAIGAAIAGAVVSAGLGAAVAPSPGRSPDLARSSRAAVLADLRTQPGRRRVEALARLGLSGDYETGRVAHYLNGRYLTPRQAEVFRRFGAQVETRPRTAHADFTGLGDAEVQGQLARGMAENALFLQDKYGADFVDEALRQEALADPEGTAARKLLASEIQRMADTDRERPVADRLDAMMQEEIAAGRNLLDDEAGLAQSVARRRAEMGDRPGVDLERELEEGPAAEQRIMDRIRHGISYRGSGQTPEDQDFRDEQQTMANIASFLQGRTPQSQFGANRNAQQGAAPVPQGSPLPGGAADAGAFAGADLRNFNARVKANRNNVGNWFAGLSTLVRGANVAGQAGWQPFAQG